MASKNGVERVIGTLVDAEAEIDPKVDKNLLHYINRLKVLENNISYNFLDHFKSRQSKIRNKRLVLGQYIKYLEKAEGDKGLSGYNNVTKQINKILKKYTELMVSVEEYYQQQHAKAPKIEQDWGQLQESALSKIFVGKIKKIAQEFQPIMINNNNNNVIYSKKIAEVLKKVDKN